MYYLLSYSEFQLDHLEHNLEVIHHNSTLNLDNRLIIFLYNAEAKVISHYFTLSQDFKKGTLKGLKITRSKGLWGCFNYFAQVLGNKGNIRIRIREVYKLLRPFTPSKAFLAEKELENTFQTNIYPQDNLHRYIQKSLF